MSWLWVAEGRSAMCVCVCPMCVHARACLWEGQTSGKRIKQLQTVSGVTQFMERESAMGPGRGGFDPPR